MAISSKHKGDGVQWPIKTSELQNNHLDTRNWNDFPFRSDDVIIAT